MSGLGSSVRCASSATRWTRVGPGTSCLLPSTVSKNLHSARCCLIRLVLTLSLSSVGSSIIWCWRKSYEGNRRPGVALTDFVVYTHTGSKSHEMEKKHPPCVWITAPFTLPYYIPLSSLLTAYYDTSQPTM